MSYTDHSAQGRLKSNAPIVVLVRLPGNQREDKSAPHGAHRYVFYCAEGRQVTDEPFITKNVFNVMKLFKIIQNSNISV